MSESVSGAHAADVDDEAGAEGSADAADFEAYRKLATEPDYEDKLAQAFEQHTQQEEIGPGDLVQWKPRLRGMKYPDYGFSAVFVRAMSDDEKKGIRKTLFGPLSVPPDIDCYIGYIDESEDFIIQPAASARLRVVRRRQAIEGG